METVFLKLLNMSITAGWIVLAVILLRLLLKKAPKWISCLLWVLVGLRLILPFSFKSILSLIPSAETVPQEIIYAEKPTIHSGVPFVNSTVNPIISESLAPQAGASVNPIQIVIFIASIAWCIGIVGMLIYAFISFLCIKHRVRFSAPLQENIYICDGISTPFILGLIKPRIYLPSLLSEKDSEYVIAHEKAHIKRLDHLWKPLGFALLTVYWFNPLLWVGYILLCRDIELACDERVIKDMSADDKKAYSSALLDCSVPRRMISACPLAFGEVGVKSRIKSVLSYKKPAFWIIVISLIACAVAAVCLLTDPKSDTSEKNVDLSDIADMNIGTDIPFIIYADDDVMYFSGSFGLIIYDYHSMTVIDRVSWEMLPDGYGFTLSWASADGETVYFERFNESPTMKYDVKNRELLPCDGADSSQHFDREHLTEEQKELLNSFYINGENAVNIDKGFYYLRADDWNMKTLQLVFHDYQSSTDSVFYIFSEFMEYNAVNSLVYTYHDSVDILNPTLTITPENQHFQFVWSGFSSYIAQGKYDFEGDFLILKTDDGLYTYVFETCEGGYRFNAERSSKIPEYRYSGDSYETQCPVPDGAVFEGDVIHPDAEAAVVSPDEYEKPLTLTKSIIPKTADWKTTGLESAGFGEADFYSSTECSLGTLHILSHYTYSSIFKDIYFALEREDDVLLYYTGTDFGSPEYLYFCDIDGDKADEIVLMLNTGGNGGAGSHTTYVWKVTDKGFETLFDFDDYSTFFDTGFEFELQAPFKLLVKNRHTGYSRTIDFSNRTGYIGAVYDEKGNPLDTWTAYHDCFYYIIPRDIDNDGVYEIECTAFTSLYGHADGIGDSVCTIKYDTKSGEFKVIDARFEIYDYLAEEVGTKDLCTIIQNSDLTYFCEIMNFEGKVIHTLDGIPKEPEVERISDFVIKVSSQGGTGLSTQWTQYFNVTTGEKSDIFYYVLCEYNGKVIYAEYKNGGSRIVVQDIFGKDNFYKVCTIAEPCAAADFVRDVQVSYNSIAVITCVNSEGEEFLIAVDTVKESALPLYYPFPLTIDADEQVYDASEFYIAVYKNGYSKKECAAIDINGNILFEDYNLPLWTNFHMINDSVLEVYMSGDGIYTSETVYYNVYTGQISPTYYAAFEHYGNNVLYPEYDKDTGSNSIIVRDFFDENVFYKKIPITNSFSAPFDAVHDVYVSPLGVATVLFFKDHSNTLYEIKIDMTKE